MSNWKQHTEIDFTDKNILAYHVDTRDFCVSVITKPEKIDTISQVTGDIYHTPEEVKNLIDRYFIESGGEGKWRMLSIEGYVNWELKYIRIYRLPEGLIVCTSNNYPLNKAILARPIEQKYLYHQ